MYGTVLEPANVRDISGIALDHERRLKVVPASTYAATTREERALFGVRNAFYGFLTTELIDFVRDFIGGRSAIEIGAGHGGLAKALDVPATDNRQQERPDVAEYYRTLRQPVIRYGENVEPLDAVAAINKYKPDVVVASWVTHKYSPARHAAGGNQDGVDEEWVVANCAAYLFIGNEQVHAAKSIWALPHKKIAPPWLYSRAINASSDFIAIWSQDTRSS